MRGSTLIGAALLACSAGAFADEAPICADRPSKSTGTCTVPKGNWQVETGLIDWTHDRSDGATANLTTFGASLIKYGLGSRVDAELGLTPLETLSVHGGGVREHHSSFGDMLFRLKYRLTSDDAPVQVALDPFVKLPTANRPLGNGKVEGGLVVPIAIPLGKGPLTVSLDPELDLLADADGDGRHVAMVQVANLGLAVNDRLSVSGELWGAWNWDPAGTIRQASADGSIAYDLTKDVQLDAGANFGLNRQTPDVELYTGVSIRF